MARLLLALSLLSVVQAWAPSSPLLPARADLRAAASEVQEVIERGEKPSGVAVPCPTEDVEIVRLGEPISVEDVTCEDGEAIFEYWMRMTVQGEQTQEYFSKLMKEAKKNANFPGFKKGQIPPYARPQMVYFCLEEAINTGMLNALDSASVKPLEGENAKAEILEDIKALSKTYKPGSPFTFTAELRAMQAVDGAAALSVSDAAVMDTEVVEPTEEDVASTKVREAIASLDSSLTKDELAEIAKALKQA